MKFAYPFLAMKLIVWLIQWTPVKMMALFPKHLAVKMNNMIYM